MTNECAILGVASGARKAVPRSALRCFGPILRAVPRTAVLVAVFGVMLAPPTAAADVLQLTNGNVIEGRVRQLPDGDYEVVIEEGSRFSVPAASVAERTAREAPVDAFMRRLESVSDSDPAGLVELAAWGEDKGLRHTLLPAYRKILRLDPHHPVARDRLGWVLHRNRWVSRGELERSGLVHSNGRWFTPEELEASRVESAVEDFRALLRDAHHENKYLRDHALERLFAIADERLRGHLVELLASPDPLDRLVAAKVLGNLPFESGAEALYHAYLEETRAEVRQGEMAVLRAFGEARLAAWIARDLAMALPGVPGETPNEVTMRNLLDLSAVCPHRACVPPLLALLGDPAWGTPAELALGRMLPGRGESSVPWATWWRDREDDLPPDLNSGWLRKKP